MACRVQALLLLLPLAACLPGRQHNRRLLQEQPLCDPEHVDRWEYEQACANVGNTNTRLPSRWAGQENFTGYNEPNPFLVHTAQGGGVSGGTLGFRTGGAQDIENFRENLKDGYLPLPTDAMYEGIVKDYYFDTTGTNQTANLTANATGPAGTVEPLVVAQAEAPQCEQLFCPIYSLAVTPDPLLVAANETAPPDIFLAVGLDSGIQASEFKRKQLNIVILLDVSGSMGSPFDTYYYDQFTGQGKQLTEEELKMTKMDVAKEVLVGITELLHLEDRFAVQLFSDSSCEPKPLGLVSCLNMTDLQEDMMRDLEPVGSTNTQEGYDRASFALRDCKDCMGANPDEVENRIILITDAQPNAGGLDPEQFRRRLEANAKQGIYTTTIGVGLDFNTEFIEDITKVKGANYYSVHSPGEFKKRLVEDFDFAVTPLVFDLSMRVDPSSLAGNDSWKILHVYGSPNPNDTALTGNGTIMNVNTLFPSPKTEEGIKGGVVLLRMKPPTAANTPLQLTVTYTDRAGKQASSRRTVGLPEQALSAAAAGQAPEDSTYFQSTGVRKAVLLARYMDLIRNWLIDQWGMTDHMHSLVIPPGACALFPSEFCTPELGELYGLERGINETADMMMTVGVDGAAGGALAGEQEGGEGGCQLERWLVPGACILPTPVEVLIPLGQWERTSEKLVVNPRAKEAIREFLPHMQSEIVALGDASMEQEVQTLLKLMHAPSTAA